MTEHKVGAVLIVGGGIAAMQSALDLADSDFKVYIVENTPSIGGTMARLDKTFPTNDCAMCIMSPKLVATGRHRNIDLITSASVKEISGEPGNFTVAIAKNARHIDEEKCTGCGVCAEECPIEAIDTFNSSLSTRSVTYVPYPQAVPLVYTIDKDLCIGCGVCENRCKANAVVYDQKDEVQELNVGSIILAPGFDSFCPDIKQEYGYGVFKNVITSSEFERILSASGPYGGLVLRQSDGQVPRSIALIQCVGSRDDATNKYCSGVCCMFAIKEAVIAKEHVATELEASIFYMDIRAFGKEFDAYYNRAQNEHGVDFIRSRVANITENPDTKNLIIHYVENSEPKEKEFELVVLSTGLEPPLGIKELTETLGIELGEEGFCQTGLFNPLETSKPGIFVCGAFQAPKDIPDSVAQASGAAAKASSIISEARGQLVVEEQYPEERDVLYERPRIGVFVCHCGINIGGIVDVPGVAEYAMTLPNVVFAEHNLYTCSQDTQEKMKDIIKEHNLNRVIVASCTPRTHEPLFQNTTRQGGLNKYLFEMTNIRDQCSWVHMHMPEAATEKSKDLVRMAVAKAAGLQPLSSSYVDVTKKGLVIGGGIAGMSAAIEISKQGYPVTLLERTGKLGGNALRLSQTTEDNPREKIAEMVKQLEEDGNITVHTGAEIDNIEGYLGNFKSTFTVNDEKQEFEHGVVVVATGAQEYRPTEYLYGHDNVITQLELEELLVSNVQMGKEIVMIQCVGARDEEHPNCSRICCTTAIKNAVRIKEAHPNTNVTILYKDIRTYALREKLYRRAAELGVRFIRYEDTSKPDVEVKDGNIIVHIRDLLLDEPLDLVSDLLVLSAANHANPDNEHLAQLLKVPLTSDGYFLEAHMKLRPVDFATEGVYVCGAAHSPKFIDESISQACATASRAATILSKDKLPSEATISVVDPERCSGCETCILVCPYNAIEKLEDKAHVIDALCKGCGACAGACRNGAIQQKGFRDDQIVSMIDAALEEVD